MLKLSSLLCCVASALLVSGLAFAPLAQAAVEEVADEDLSAVSGGDGITISFSLVWNADALREIDLSQSSSITMGYFDATKGRHTSLVFQGFGGIVDMWNIKIDSRKGPASVGDYVDITLPNLVAFKQFGFRALYAESYDTPTPPAPQDPPNSYGKWLLNGAATLTGSVNIWPAK